jgi:hypothetical protein
MPIFFFPPSYLVSLFPSVQNRLFVLVHSPPPTVYFHFTPTYALLMVLFFLCSL